MNYDVYEQDPGTYFLLLLISLGITVLTYGAFPVLFARSRKKIISKKKYTMLCYGINFLVMILFIAVNGESSGAPYILWTWVFSKSGLKTLTNNGLIEGNKAISPEDCPNRLAARKHVSQQVGSAQPTQTTKKICFCRKCGEALKDDCRFCYKCGTEIYFDNRVH